MNADDLRMHHRGSQDEGSSEGVTLRTYAWDSEMNDSQRAITDP